MGEIDNIHLFKVYREFLALSQAGLAELMGTTQTSVARWEAGLSPIQRPTLAHIQAQVELKMMRELGKLRDKIASELGGYQVSQAIEFHGTPSGELTNQGGILYLGVALITMNGRSGGYSLYFRINDAKWYNLDTENNAVNVDTNFFELLRRWACLKEKAETPADFSANLKVQKARLRKFAESIPGVIGVVFDDTLGPNSIRFRLEATNGRMLGITSDRFRLEEIARYSDDTLLPYVSGLASVTRQA